MAINIISNTDGVYAFSGLSTDTKGSGSLVDANGAAVKYKVNSTFTEADTGNDFEYKGATAGWIQTSFGGAMGVQSASGSVWSYGNWPSSLYLEGTATGAAAGTIYTSGTVSNYNRFTLEVADRTATSADVYASIDGTNFLAVKLIDVSTGALFATTAITADGLYYLDGKYKAIRVDQVGAGAVTIRFSHGNV